MSTTRALPHTISTFFPGVQTHLSSEIVLWGPRAFEMFSKENETKNE